MTDDHDDSLDELLSADLDDETTAAERARIEADPGLRARREELRSASELVAQQPAPLGRSVVDEAVRRALDDASADDAPQQPTRRPPSRRRRSGAMPSPLLVAAAVILLAAIGIGLIISAPSSRRSKSADQSSSAASEKRASKPTSPAGAARSEAPGFIGDFATPSALRRALTSQLPSRSNDAAAAPSAQLSVGQADRCATVVEAHDSRLKAANRQEFAASIAGDPVLVLVYRAEAVGSNRSTTRIVAVGRAACDERVNFQR